MPIHPFRKLTPMQLKELKHQIFLIDLIRFYNIPQVNTITKKNSHFSEKKPKILYFFMLELAAISTLNIQTTNFTHVSLFAFCTHFHSKKFC